MSERTSDIETWFLAKNWKPFDFQRQTWRAFFQGQNGIVNAPTGSGKTYSLLIPALQEAQKSKRSKGLSIIWITPIRALAKEIEQSANNLIRDCFPELSVGIRTGDTHPAVRQKQKKSMPSVLITTPESLHLLFTDPNHHSLFRNLNAIVVDEWHELLGSKRGVQVELAVQYLRSLNARLKIWGISATIGNMNQALEVLLGSGGLQNGCVIKSQISKKLEVKTLFPEAFERLPWSGHIGTKLSGHVVKVINNHASTLIFTNTRAQCEIWYRTILESAPELSGLVAMHHSALSKDIRHWVEDALYDGKLKAVVCTSSLDLGVDFRPVEAVVQIGGPKGVARFVQRAGRSGHQPGARSKIYFLPTHALELIEAAALKTAVKQGIIEDRIPYIRCFDVLVQFLTTLTVGGGFKSKELYAVINKTHAFGSVDEEEWNWCLHFITTGSKALEAYPEFRKVELEEGVYKIASIRQARKHRMSIGTIVGDTMVQVKYRKGGRIGFVEEYFAASLNEGDVFWFAGRSLEALSIRDLKLEVKNSKRKAGRTPSWQGGRLPLSSMLSSILMQKVDEFSQGVVEDEEMERLADLLELQQNRSLIPDRATFLIESTQTREGYHLFFFPFEGRLVHEGLASLIAWRLSQLTPVTFSMSFNDYGFELLSDTPISIQEAVDNGLFSTEELMSHLESSINSAEMARRKFRDIAVISGMIFRGYPGEQIKDRHLQSSSSLIYEVFEDYDNENLLFRQAFDEMLEYQLEIGRFRRVMKEINQKNIQVTFPEKPTPLAFPLMVDRLRERMSSEKLEDRVAKMQRQFDR